MNTIITITITCFWLGVLIIAALTTLALFGIADEYPSSVVFSITALIIGILLVLFAAVEYYITIRPAALKGLIAIILNRSTL